MRGPAAQVGMTALAVLAAGAGAAAQERTAAVCVHRGVRITRQDGAAVGDAQISITAPGGRIDIEPLAGVAAIAHDRWSKNETSRPWLPPGQNVEVGPRIRDDTVTGAAFVGGADVRIGGGRVAVVPGFRIRAGTQGEDLVAQSPGGFPRWTIGGGVTARVVF